MVLVFIIIRICDFHFTFDNSLEAEDPFNTLRVIKAPEGIQDKQFLLITPKEEVYRQDYWNIYMFLLFPFFVQTLIQFYIFMEFTILLFIWIFFYRAYKERRNSFTYIVIYILIFSLPFLITLISDDSAVPNNVFLATIGSENTLLWFLAVAIFLNKIPLFGTHFWLLKAHTYSTTWGRVLLASLMLKVGVLGYIYVSSNFYSHTHLLEYFIYVGVIIASINIIFITDLKIIIAQSSVTHITLLFLALYKNCTISLYIGMIFCIIHGIVSTIIFIFSETIINACKSRNLVNIKWIRVTTITFILFILINNSFPMTPYRWCELWLIITLHHLAIVYFPILLVIVITCSVLFFIWIVNIKAQITSLYTPNVYLYDALLILPHLMLFFMWYK